MNFLNEKYPVEPKITLELSKEEEINPEILDQLDENVNPNVLYFGLYIPEMGHKIISLGAFWPEYASMILLLIAHEYYHCKQHLKKVSFNERQADSWAVRVLTRYIIQKRGLIKKCE